MAKLPPFRDSLPIGRTQRGDTVLMSREFRQFLQLISRDVSIQDGAAPGGSDFVIFPSYPREQQVCVSANYARAAADGAVRADYRAAEKTAVVTAQYGAGAGAVTFARY